MWGSQPDLNRGECGRGRGRSGKRPRLHLNIIGRFGMFWSDTSITPTYERKVLVSASGLRPGVFTVWYPNPQHGDHLELVGIADSWAPAQTCRSDTLRVGLNNLCFSSLPGGAENAYVWEPLLRNQEPTS